MTGVTSARNTLGHEAVAYASRGIKVFPLWWPEGEHSCACNDGPDCGSPAKHPRTRNGVLVASNDPGQVEAWWALWPYANIGIPAGPNGLAIIDVDPYHGGSDALDVLDRWALDKHGLDLSATYTVRTGSGGVHRYYREPPGGIKPMAKAFGAAGIDTRGRNGYVVAPPSIHVSGQRYEVITEGLGLQPWPAILTELMEYKTPPTEAPAARVSTATDRAGRWARAALAAECDALRNMTREGSGRNNALNAAAYKLGRRVGAGYLDRNEAASALYAAASGWLGHTERELRNTIASGLNAGIARPHTGPTGGQS